MDGTVMLGIAGIVATGVFLAMAVLRTMALNKISAMIYKMYIDKKEIIEHESYAPQMRQMRQMPKQNIVKQQPQQPRDIYEELGEMPLPEVQQVRKRDHIEGYNDDSLRIARKREEIMEEYKARLKELR